MATTVYEREIGVGDAFTNLAERIGVDTPFVNNFQLSFAV